MKSYRLFILLLLTGFAACTGEKKGAGSEEEQTVETVLPDRINEVTVITLVATDFQHELISNGKLSARRHADLRFETAEPIATIHVKNGDRVSRGQTLAELATFRLDNKVEQARDALDRATLDLQDLLIGQGFAPEDTLAVPPSTLQLIRIRSGYSQALTQYSLALHEAENAILKAPFDGLVANLFAKPFNLASTADAFCAVIDPHSLEASFTVLENELPLIRTGDHVTVSPYALTGETAEGRIDEINPLVDEHGMVQVRASVAHSGKLFEGMNVRVSIRRSLGKQFAVPREAVVLRSGKQVVFTLVDGKSFWNYVQTGLENAGYYTVTEGLKEGDTVIVSGNINLAHESPVKVIQ
jgi:RND family efflux transporter MFP subunit